MSAAPAKRVAGLAHGFDVWTELEGDRRSGADTNRDAFAWLDSTKEPFSLWIHYMDVLGPYGPKRHPPLDYALMSK